VAGRSLTAGELRALFLCCAEDPTPAGVRDAALLGVSYGAGLRISEVVGPDLSDYELESGAIRVHESKGRKSRTAYARGVAREAVDACVEIRGPEAGPRFGPITQRGQLCVRAMSDRALFKTFQKQREQARIRPFSPHDLLRTFAGDLLDSGADLSTVQDLMGHADPRTTKGYDRRGERRKRDAAFTKSGPC
jgi:site-specific recombinase XerD